MKSSTFDNQLLALIFNAAPISGLAQNASSPNASLYLALHTAAPGVGGVQSTAEAAYPGYARVAVPRTPAGFTVSGSSVNLTFLANFPAATGGNETETWFSAGTAASGAGEILYSGPISPAIAVSNGVTPQLGAGTTITES